MPLPNLSGNPAEYTVDTPYIGVAANASIAPGLSFRSSATEAPVVFFGRTPGNVGSPTVAIQVWHSGSAASTPMLLLSGQAFVSAVSIVFAASANWAGMGGIRVALPDGTNYGWIPIIPVASFTAAARG